MTQEEILKDRFKNWLDGFLDIPYIWGGKDPKVGLDCSGLVHNALSIFGIQPAMFMNAEQMWAYYSKLNPQTVLPEFGALAFYGNAKHIHHVGICLNDTYMIEAAHGGRDWISEDIALKKGAKVEGNKINRVQDLYSILRPP